jgi:hypothetical protein
LCRGKKVIDDNFYWSSCKNGSCTNLNRLPQVTLPLTASKVSDGKTYRLEVHISNPTHHVGLMIRLKVVRANSGERVLPIFYEDNYFSLLPSESRTISIQFAAVDLAGEQPKLAMEGWNIAPEDISINYSRAITPTPRRTDGGEP